MMSEAKPARWLWKARVNVATSVDGTGTRTSRVRLQAGKTYRFVCDPHADEMRGRVLSLLTLSTFGLQPLGAVQAGTLASVIGPGPAVMANGLICVLLAIVVWVRFPRIRALG